VVREGPTIVRAVDGVSLEIDAGEFVALEGPSGSGKTTLLQLLGALDRPSEGVVAFEGRDLATLRDNELARLRLGAFGFVFQQFNLIPTLSAVQTSRPHSRRPASTAPSCASARRRFSPRSGSPRVPSISRRSCPVASSSGSRSRAPWRRSRG
jgi:predicted ABC-type transport system involved in lysophospholipase L1 biosynthesis ATPase subunit